MKPKSEGGTMQPPKSELDPRYANVGFRYDEIVPGYGCVGRVYYWYDPNLKLPAIDEHELRSQHPEIGDREWDRLFYEAFDRGEKEFVERALVADSELDSSPTGRQVLALGRLFGPRRPT
jgi:hypothetical protein